MRITDTDRVNWIADNVIEINSLVPEHGYEIVEVIWCTDGTDNSNLNKGRGKTTKAAFRQALDRAMRTARKRTK